MKLYFSPGACSLSPHIALLEGGLKADYEQVDLKAKTMKSGGDYREINPKGAVPALKTDEGDVLTEGPAIVQYIADLAPGSELAPKAGTKERYKLMEWLNFISTELHKTFSPLFRPNAPDEYKTITKENLVGKFEYVDKKLAKTQYLMGDHFHGRRCISLRHPALGAGDEARHVEIRQSENVFRTRRRTPESAGSVEGRRTKLISRRSPAPRSSRAARMRLSAARWRCGRTR